MIYIDNVTIYDMGFNARIIHALERAKVKNLYDLSQMNFYQLQRIRNLGASSLEKVISFRQFTCQKERTVGAGLWLSAAVL